ncbi:hypothetical protein BP00DRAFT_15746 [Aspergillus indologenus CBS 114.80]|uniref:Uncharacterized protein n=1 Tax=Aspergillus indologenus CBS 114.80 TaxID=1450541 RepID=A0A2V5HT22_9EURO|nr:hypothetical protein BP00DRAFT_15746 [Aspergillus indologenus CBS 114.80]
MKDEGKNEPDLQIVSSHGSQLACVLKALGETTYDRQKKKKIGIADQVPLGEMIYYQSRLGGMMEYYYWPSLCSVLEQSGRHPLSMKIREAICGHFIRPRSGRSYQTGNRCVPMARGESRKHPVRHPASVPKERALARATRPGRGLPRVKRPARWTGTVRLPGRCTRLPKKYRYELKE